MLEKFLTTVLRGLLRSSGTASNGGIFFRFLVSLLIKSGLVTFWGQCHYNGIGLLAVLFCSERNIYKKTEKKTKEQEK